MIPAIPAAKTGERGMAERDMFKTLRAGKADRSPESLQQQVTGP